jgi:hypothetical protein
MKTKKVVVISDLHCGHRGGLTPTAWQYKQSDEKNKRWACLQHEIYSWYCKTMDALAPIDVLIVNGDAIDGRGTKSGGTEQITSDRDVQCDIAIHAIKRANAKSIRMLYGTSYHTSSDGEDWEDHISDCVGADIGAHDIFDINGVLIDCKHHVGSSGIPHGRATPILKEHLWSILWAEQQNQPKVDILIRSHVHYLSYSAGLVGPTLVMTTPALQGYGSKFGSRICSGLVQVGMLSFDIANKGEWSWKAHILNLKSQAQVPEKL